VRVSANPVDTKYSPYEWQVCDGADYGAMGGDWQKVWD